MWIWFPAITKHKSKDLSNVITEFVQGWNLPKFKRLRKRFKLNKDDINYPEWCKKKSKNFYKNFEINRELWLGINLYKVTIGKDQDSNDSCNYMLETKDLHKTRCKFMYCMHFPCLLPKESHSPSVSKNRVQVYRFLLSPHVYIYIYMSKQTPGHNYIKYNQSRLQ